MEDKFEFRKFGIVPLTAEEEREGAAEVGRAMEGFFEAEARRISALVAALGKAREELDELAGYTPGLGGVDRSLEQAEECSAWLLGALKRGSGRGGATHG